MIMKRQSVSIVLVGEGITEKYYFDSLRDILKIKPKALVSKHTNVFTLEKHIKDCIKSGYDRIYCIIDLDNKTNDNRPEHRKNHEAYIKLKKKYHKKKFKNYDGDTEVYMIESYPSSELFFLFYFGYRGAEFSNDELKKLLFDMTGYKVEERFFIRNSLHNLFEKKGGSLLKVIEASERSVRNRESRNPHASFTEIGLMLKELL